MEIPVTKVSDGAGGYILINESDFDSVVHVLFDENPLPPPPPAEEAPASKAATKKRKVTEDGDHVVERSGAEVPVGDQE